MMDQDMDFELAPEPQPAFAAGAGDFFPTPGRAPAQAPFAAAPQPQMPSWAPPPPPPAASAAAQPPAAPGWSLPPPSPAGPRRSPLTIDPEAETAAPWSLRTPTRAHVQRGNTPMSCDSPFNAFASGLSPLVQLKSPPGFGIYQEQAFFAGGEKSPGMGAFFGASAGVPTAGAAAAAIAAGASRDADMLPPTPRRTLLAGMELGMELTDSDSGSPFANTPQGLPPQMPPAFSSPQQQQQQQQQAMPVFATPDAHSGHAGAGAADISPAQHQGAVVKRCNCRKSRCLKLYCECFSAGRYCDGCGCSCCSNTVDNEELRQKAMAMVKRRNPNAFKQKIVARVLDTGTGGVVLAGAVHRQGCNCRRSQCLKRYCECFSAGVPCTDACKCVGCQNAGGEGCGGH